MPSSDEQTVLNALRRIKAADGSNIVDSGLVEGIAVKNGQASFSLAVDAEQGAAFEPLRAAAERAVREIPGITGVTAVLTAHKAAPGMRASHRPEKMPVPGVKHIIAVASGKGGVGKSTTAVNLAIALQGLGRKTGLLDADIYGPSIPRMLNLKGKPQTTDDKKLVPMERFGLAVMSMGFLIAEDAPMIWRGPMVHGAVTQMFRDVTWNARGDLDVLVVDLPPGTGDAQLTLAQSVPLAGAVIVSTPQDIALLDARKGLAMFRRVEAPVLGIVENMSYFKCPHCGERSDIFSHGGARHEAEKLGIPFLGEIPLEIAIRETSDAGEPITVAQPQSAVAAAYRHIAEAVWGQIEECDM
jgi:ATP-binding protein involved in chromosome partitioning